MTTTRTITKTKDLLAAYRATSHRRILQRRLQLDHHKQLAWSAARRAAQLLRDQFGVTRVVIFGSLANEDCFTIWSDVDIAAWGIAPEQTFRAIGAARDVSKDIEVNLVDVTTCRSAIRHAIKQHGVDL